MPLGIDARKLIKLSIKRKLIDNNKGGDDMKQIAFTGNTKRQRINNNKEKESFQVNLLWWCILIPVSLAMITFPGYLVAENNLQNLNTELEGCL